MMISEIFPWNKNFELGIDVIDEQHEKLVSLINKLANKLAAQSSEVQIHKVLNELVDYTIYHFTTEEAIWNQCLSGDAMMLEHINTHQDFVDEINTVKKNMQNVSESNVSEKVLSYLTHWLVFHILDTDRRMAQIIINVEQGMDLQQAKEHARNTMNGAMTALIESVLSMYDSLSIQTLALMREIAERQRAEQKLMLSKSVIDNTFESVFVTDETGTLVDVNPAFCAYFQLDDEDVLGEKLHSLKSEVFAQQAVQDIWTSATLDGHCSGEVSIFDANGRQQVAWLTLSVIKNQQGQIVNYAGVLSSVSQLLERQHDLEEEANHDQLTGLPNRRLFDDRLQQALYQQRRHQKKLAVCFLDLDGFKAVNDTFGHDAGDQLLCEIAKRLQENVRGIDTVARMGGDEFILLIGDLHDQHGLITLLDKILACIEQPVQMDGNQARVSASIGVSLCPDDSDNAELLLKYADQAMYQAKDAGKSQFCFFEADKV